jgi:hypothetical protein
MRIPPLAATASCWQQGCQQDNHSNCENDCEMSAQWVVHRGRAQECSDVREHVKGTFWLRCYEESKGTHDASSEAVNLRRMIIAAPHVGHCQTVLGKRFAGGAGRISQQLTAKGKTRSAEAIG